MARKRVINIVTLGCSKNLVDSEHLARQLRGGESDIEVIYDSNRIDCDAVIINTCGFIQDAKEESVDTILQFIQAKNSGKTGEVFVMGCLSQRYKKDLEKEIPEVDRYFGVNDIQQIVKMLDGQFRNELLNERVLSTPKHLAYLKISEGCSRNCAFCAIPLIRGKHISRSIDGLITETRNLGEQGAREFLMIAQDLSYYGLDLYNKQMLPELIEHLLQVDYVKWLRLHYLYPDKFPLDLIPLIKNNPVICNYLDIPFQHISDPVLKRMKRGHSRKTSYSLIEKIRTEIPGISLRTTLMTGYPGETEDDFRQLLDFVREVRFERLGVFTYSEEEGTAAFKFSDDVSEELKEERKSEIMSLQENISKEINSEKIGQFLRVIIDREEGEFYIGRSEYDSYEVDNEVIVKSDKKLIPGNFYEVKIENADEFELHAKID